MNTADSRAAVVVGVDGSEQSYAAAIYALQEAESLGCSLLLVHAYRPVQNDYWTEGSYIDLRHAGDHVLHEFADMLRREAAPATQITTMLCAGDPAGTLVQMSHDSPCIVVGRRPAGWIQHAIVSSVSTRLSSVAWCPSVTIPHNCTDLAASGPVAVVADSVAETPACLAYAAATAGRHGIGVVLTHAAPLGHHEWPSDDDILRIAVAVESSRRAHPHTDFTTDVVREPIDEAAERISEGSFALVVSQAGSPNLLGWRRSPVNAVLKKARCPVITVPSAKRAARTETSPTREPHPFRFPRW